LHGNPFSSFIIFHRSSTDKSSISDLIDYSFDELRDYSFFLIFLK